MTQPRTTTYSITDFLEWKASRQLVIAPKFQRRNIWSQKAKSYLIDTILRGLPIPPLFIRAKVDPTVRKAVREVVDGQQRLRSVFEFIEGKFPIMKAHNVEFAGMFYHELPETTQHDFLRYHFAVNILEDVSDSEVLNIFARMNTYTEPLNAQELRNAMYFGPFKQTIYELAHRYYTFWRKNNILTEHQVARMKDAELVSILVVTMLDGIRQTKRKDLKTFYEKYDDEFPEAERTKQEFGTVIDMVGHISGDRLPSSPFRRHPLFYSLFTLLYDARYGLPRSESPGSGTVKFTSERSAGIAERVWRFAETIRTKQPPDRFHPFLQATRLSTADVDKRQLRHDVLWTEVIEPSQ